MFRGLHGFPVTVPTELILEVDHLSLQLQAEQEEAAKVEVTEGQSESEDDTDSECNPNSDIEDLNIVVEDAEIDVKNEDS